jgi:hypothetical protein
MMQSLGLGHIPVSVNRQCTRRWLRSENLFSSQVGCCSYFATSLVFEFFVDSIGGAVQIRAGQYDTFLATGSVKFDDKLQIYDINLNQW